MRKRKSSIPSLMLHHKNLLVILLQQLLSIFLLIPFDTVCMLKMERWDNVIKHSTSVSVPLAPLVYQRLFRPLLGS